MALREWGWNEHWELAFKKLTVGGLIPGRVAIQHRGAFAVYTEFGEMRAHAAGKMRHSASDASEMPAVGDWVALHSPEHSGAAIITAVLPRKSAFLRKTAGTKSVEQVIAANIDLAFLVSGLDDDFNLRRLERYVVLSIESGARPAIILNKSDICANIEEVLGAVESVAPGIPVHVLSAVEETGFSMFQEYLSEGVTGVLLGSSGVGKSTIINALLGENRQAVQEIRESDGEGRHTTSRRELMLLPSGGMLIDTPGMRELQLWGDGESLGEAFSDIEELGTHCKFRDCGHEVEPGCAIREAIETGVLDQQRYEHYQKLLKELAYLERRRDQHAQREEKKRAKKLSNDQKHLPKKR